MLCAHVHRIAARCSEHGRAKHGSSAAHPPLVPAEIYSRVCQRTAKATPFRWVSPRAPRHRRRRRPLFRALITRSRSEEFEKRDRVGIGRANTDSYTTRIRNLHRVFPYPSVVGLVRSVIIWTLCGQYMDRIRITQLCNK